MAARRRVTTPIEYQYRRTGVTAMPVLGETKFALKRGSRQDSCWFEQLVHIMQVFDTFDRTGLLVVLATCASGELPTYGSVSAVISIFFNEGYIEAVPSNVPGRALCRVYTEQEIKRLPAMRGIKLNLGKNDWKGAVCYRKTDQWPKFITRFRKLKNGDVDG